MSCSLVDFQDHRRHIQKHFPEKLYKPVEKVYREQKWYR
nr:MAG TPA: hypothetical protein [Caudoviricetes sp.]